ncbi:efflux RND transporter permease subunit [Acidiphilium acidophilum]|uniref:Efflux RND transporter permease subunit n=1 Tax=Acidiphilium acidophilum TaxID=76588 RepID=A0AAW9DVC2_ACIAO|nr:efflux RND transporter permease subunit [Acidiphilium acidophilum]MDX5932268.1 efflux RND transporter permease subunit [Acidiphilium acidophilum]
MGLARFLARQQRAILFLMASLALAGVVAALFLPVGLFPQTSFPRVRINIDAGARPAQQMVLQVTKPVEQALRAIPGVVSVRSATSRGSAQIYVDFGWGQDMGRATLEVDAAIAQMLPDFPAGTRYLVRRMDPTVFPIIAYAMISHSIPETALRAIAEDHIVPDLTRIAGVAKVNVQGGATPEVHVLIAPHRLAAMHVTLAQVEQAVSKANVLAAVGRMTDYDRLYLVVQDNTLHTARQIGRIAVRGGPDGVVRLDQVATVRMGTVPVYDRVAQDGVPAVTLQVFQQPDGNAVAVDAAVRKALAAYRAELPRGVTLVKWYDQSGLVTAAAGSVRDAILIGIVLAGLVLIGFLRSWRVTLVALLVVPASMASAILLLSLLGLSFNIMTLGGLAASVGLVIDDAIVMIEHIARRAGHAAGAAAKGAVLAAASEFLPPLTGSSMATLIVFMPLAFLSGVTGAFFKALSITLAATLVASWLLSAFAVPVLARALIDFDRWQDPAERRSRAGREGWMERWHALVLGRLMGRPVLLALGIVPLIVVGLLAYRAVPTGFLPHLDEGGFVVNYQTRPGTSLGESVREVRQIEAILRADPAVATFSRRTGAGLGGDLNEPYQGDIFVDLKPRADRAAIWAVMDRLRTRIESRVPGVDFDMSQMLSDLLGDLTGVPQPIEIKLDGDPAELDATARKVGAAIAKIPGVVSMFDGVTLAGDAVNIHVDPARAAMLGLDAEQIRQGLQTAIEGSVVTALPGDYRFTGVRVMLPAADHADIAALRRIPIATASGALVPVGDFARFSIASGQPEIDRENLQQIAAVTARISGRGIGGVIGDVRRTLAQPGLIPAGMHYTLGGLYKQQQIAFRGLAKVFVAAMAAEFILLLFLYRSFVIAGAILFTALLASLAVFIGLFVSGVQLNITALMGMTMIVGLATEMAIFYVSEYQALAEHNDRRDSLVMASRNRLRPIAMTTLAAILTLLPLAFALGEGSGMQQPLAIAIISGFLVQFPLVLLALPVLLKLALPRAE